MITEYKIRKLAYLDTASLESAIRPKYPGDRFISSRFLGITNGGEFCYDVLYFDSSGEEQYHTKVFVDLDTSEEPVADYWGNPKSHY
ncbi:MAG: hypothetical protein FJ211_09930 [Ignavibacteria bacterium]|nr:hypothetical protein [Ignavibacteria bacterium]